METKEIMDAIDEASKALKEKAEGAFSKAQEALTKATEVIAELEKKASSEELEALKKELSDAKEELQKQHNALSAKVNTPTPTQNEGVKSFNQYLAETISNNADNIRSFRKGSPELKLKFEVKDEKGEVVKDGFDVKAVGDMSIPVNFPGATPWTQDVRNGLIETPYNRVWLADTLPQGSSTGSSVIYPKENGGEGAVGLWDSEANVDKPQVDYDFTSQTAFFKWLAGIAIVEREMLDDIPWLTSYLQQKLLISLKTAENDFVYNGAATASNPVQGMNAAATAYDGTYTAAVDRIIDAGWGQIVENTENFYQPTHVILRPRDAVAVGLNKADGSGEYDLPNGVNAFQSNRQIVGFGFTTVPTTQIAQNNFLVYDRNALAFIRRMAPEIRMFEDAALAKRNKVMFRIEERVTLAIFNNAALVKGTLVPPTP